MNDATKEELLEILIEKEDEIDWLKAELDESTHLRKLSDAECVTLRKERDEARQRYCFAMAEHGEEAEARQNAKDEGWDCFKEDSDD